ncbi:MAG: DNA-binding response OmpR family regulator/Tfp pilus assembly protein PilF [Oceanicoccus sp.]|jgi:DNA-binding response OmpR family regulator/Tfp pilus assembly protein PilF
MALSKLDLLKIYKHKSVLIIDDYPDMRGSIRRMVENFGVKQVETVSNGEHAIAKCEESSYDIILADYNLGDGKNGQQVLEELRYKNLLEHKCIYMMITAETTKDMVFGALEYQPDDYLTKPFTLSVLEKRLDRLIVEKEALYEINDAIDKENLDRAIALCQQRINMHDKYEFRCFRIMGGCLYKKREFDKAKQVYQGILRDRDLEWANIGLGKSLIELGELDAAEEVFGNLIDNGCLCLEIYDCMAEIHSRRGQSESAQRTLQKAIELSPNAILRQEKLADVSEDIHDWEQAELSRKKVIRLGNNSVYESPENHFKLARTITAEMEYNDNPKQRQKDIDEVLRKVKRKFKSETVDLQSDILEANVFAKAGDVERSKTIIENVQSRLEKTVDKPTQLMLDMAQSYSAAGDRDSAKKLLKELAEMHADDVELSDAIDRISDEPLSKKGKQQAVDLNTAGKKLFTGKEYDKAIELFSQGLKHYPNNMGLNLNLMLALVREMTANGANTSQLDRCGVAKDKLKHVNQDNPLFDRYKVLCDHYEKLRKSVN